MNTLQGTPKDVWAPAEVHRKGIDQNLVGLLLVRRHLLPRLRVAGEDSEFTGAMMQPLNSSAITTRTGS